MSKERIKQLIDGKLCRDGTVETSVKGVSLFRVTEPMRCAPVVYEPCVVAIISGSKQAILDGKNYEYDNSQYLCCTTSMPVEAGTPYASPSNPLLGVLITLDTQVITKLAIEMQSAAPGNQKPTAGPLPASIALSSWDDSFIDALYRVLTLDDCPTRSSVLGSGRLKELYYAVLNGEAGESARRSFGLGNEIARAIDYVSTHLDEKITIDQLASYVGMSRAVFHRKFKQATTLSPIQFIKCMRLNHAAMNIMGGMNVNKAAMTVGYESPSQFNREFKRLYGQTPKQWGQAPINESARSYLAD